MKAFISRPFPDYIKRFDPIIYPPKLWVCVAEDFKVLNGLFSDIDDNTEIDFGKFEKYEAVTINVITKEPEEFGVLIIFKPQHLDCETIAHEASHAAGYIFYHIGSDMDSGEPTAYLIGWIAKCCRSLLLRL
jgi:hypothetical protein